MFHVTLSSSKAKDDEEFPTKYFKVHLEVFFTLLHCLLFCFHIKIGFVAVVKVGLAQFWETVAL
jgi:hypothetical protein